MKYIASTRPMTMPNSAISRPCASGWRETPWMVALPPRPSPMAAPMAPPPSARPAPISAPATAIAWFMESPPRLVGCGRGGGRRAIGVVGGGRVRAVLLLQTFASGAEVHDRQQHEDERLQAPDEEHVEELPQDQADHGHRRPVDRRLEPQGQQVDHQHAGEDVAEEPQRQCDRLDQLL